MPREIKQTETNNQQPPSPEENVPKCEQQWMENWETMSGFAFFFYICFPMTFIKCSYNHYILSSCHSAWHSSIILY